MAAVLFRRLTQKRIALERVWDVLALVACAALGTLISAVFGVVSLRLGDVITADEFGSVFRTWWLGDFSGALVFTPLILVWAARRTWRMPPMQLAEAVLLLTVLIVLIEVPSQRDVPYIVFTVLIWAALRFGPFGAATALAITSSLTVWNTAHGSGPFVRASITHSVLASQLFVTVAALTSLILAAVTAERTASERAQQALTDEQTALRRIATLVAGEAASDRVFEQVTVEAAQTLGASAASLARFDEDGTVTFVGGWSDTGRLAFPVGSRVPVEETGVLAEIRKTGRPERIDDYKGRAPEIVERLSSFGYGSAGAAPIRVGGQVWGALVAAAPRDEPLAPGSERRLADFAELVAQALANADAYRKLAASRVRIVEAGDTERRRLERNLHDGAQQRLVSLALRLRMVRASLRKDPESAEALLAQANRELDHALEELRELARGIHPAVLTIEVSRLRSAHSPTALRSRSSSLGFRKTGCRTPSKQRSTTSSPRRSRTLRSTRKRHAQALPSNGRTGLRRWSCATTESEARSLFPARDSSVSRIASKRSAVGCTSKARRDKAHSSPPRSRADEAEAIDL